MTPAEQIAALTTENAALRQQVADLQTQLAAALACIAELERRTAVTIIQHRRSTLPFIDAMARMRLVDVLSCVKPPV